MEQRGEPGPMDWPPALQLAAATVPGAGGAAAAAGEDEGQDRLRVRAQGAQTCSKEEGVACEACSGAGWLLCDFCKGKKNNVKSEGSRVYRRCPTCKAAGFVLCPRCRVYKCITFPESNES